MNNKIRMNAIIIILLLCFGLTACSYLSFTPGTYGDAAIYGPCIFYQEKYYVLESTILELPDDAIYLGKSTDSKTQIVDGAKLAHVSNLKDVNKEIYFININPNSDFYISPNEQIIYANIGNSYDCFIAES